jgi:hypothetical protein
VVLDLEEQPPLYVHNLVAQFEITWIDNANDIKITEVMEPVLQIM